jgi:hypothetical protein
MKKLSKRLEVSASNYGPNTIFLVYQRILVYNHFNQPFLVYILITLFSSLLFFQQTGSMPGVSVNRKVNEIIFVNPFT